MQRKTTQREAIRRAFEESEGPLSPQEILDAARVHAPGLGIATVYRTIKDMLGGKELTEVEVPGQPSRYEAAGKPHHHHFHCRVCGKMFEVHACAHDLEHLTPKGFHLEDHEILLRGVCSSCAQKK